MTKPYAEQDQLGLGYVVPPSCASRRIVDSAGDASTESEERLE